MGGLPADLPDLPPYTYVPGYAAHPVSDPAGHMRNFQLPATWSESDHLQWGKRLFQHGYYWEAHEAWEHLWMELGRTSREALTVKGLIKLAACGVKCREGNRQGAIRHATRAGELLQAEPDATLFAGVNLAAARESAVQIAASPPVEYVPPSNQPAVLPGLEI